MDKDKAEVYKILTDIIMKVAFGITAIVAFFLLLNKFLDTTLPDTVRLTYAGGTGLFGIVIVIAYKHFFPPPPSS